MAQSKNSLLIALLALISAFIISPQAHGETVKYLGLKLLQTQVNYAQANINAQNIDLNNYYPQNLNSLGFYFGQRLGMFALETTVYITNEKTKTATLPDKTNLSSTAFLISVASDALLFVPLDKEKQFELFGSLGFASSTLRTRFEPSSSSPLKNSSTREIKLNIGAGLQYVISPKWKIRAAAKWQDAHFNSQALNSYVFGISLHHYF
jgi:opacity protein-like surface antigen